MILTERKFTGKILFFLMGISPLFVLIAFLPFSPKRDWDYFNSLALVLKEYLIQGKVPLLDSWICGGIDILSNPQNWFFSPFIILNIIFSPYLGNVISLLIAALAGFTGMMKLVKDEDNATSLFVSTLFILSPFFFLHFAEGHLTFRTFYFLPWIIYLSRNLSIRRFLFLTAILCFMFLDGGIYPMYYSLILMTFNMNFKALKEMLHKDLKNVCLIVFGAGLILLSKILPVLFIHNERTPQDERISYSLSNIANALYNIKQTNFTLLEGQVYYFHEYGHYIGIALTVLVLLSLKDFIKHKLLLSQLILYGWTALGIGGAFNPWSLIKLIPFINHMHVQSRFLIMFWIVLLLLLSHSTLKNTWKKILFSIGLLELLFCGFYVTTHAFQDKRPVSDIRVDRINHIQQFDQYIPKPDVYHSGKMSFLCYEPANTKFLQQTPNLFLMSEENMSLSAQKNVITIRSETPLQKSFILNYNWNAGWDCKGCEASENKGLIQVNPHAGTMNVELTYNPVYLQFILVSCFTGIFLLLFIFIRLRKHEF